MKKVQEMMAEQEKMRIPIAQGLPWTTDEPEVRSCFHASSQFEVHMTNLSSCFFATIMEYLAHYHSFGVTYCSACRVYLLNVRYYFSLISLFWCPLFQCLSYLLVNCNGLLSLISLFWCHLFQCLLKPTVKESTRPIDLKLHSDIRAMDRAEFDQQVPLSFISSFFFIFITQYFLQLYTSYKV